MSKHVHIALVDDHRMFTEGFSALLSGSSDGYIVTTFEEPVAFLEAIAEALDINENTVKSHLRSIFEGLGVRTRTACVHKAVVLGLIQLARRFSSATSSAAQPISLTLSGYSVAGRYAAVLDIAANDNGQAVLVVAGANNGLRLAQQRRRVWAGNRSRLISRLQQPDDIG